MSQSDVVGTSVGSEVEYKSIFKANAQLYRAHKAIVNAASRYDNLDDAIAGLTTAWTALVGQVTDGAGYTPDRDLGFGSDNGRVIAETLIGIRTTPGATRKAFAELGK